VGRSDRRRARPAAAAAGPAGDRTRISSTSASAWHVGRCEGRSGRDPDRPDSKLVREAESAAREQGVALAGHGYRTWLLGHALACQDGHVLDQELFYVAALLHDAA